MKDKWIILIPDAPENVWPYLHSHFSMPVFKKNLEDAKKFDTKRAAIDVIMQWDLDYCNLEKYKPLDNETDNRQKP